MQITPEIVYDTLSYLTWKRGRTVVEEVKEQCGRQRTPWIEVYFQLANLEEGTVEHREEKEELEKDEWITYQEYRKISGRSRPRRSRYRISFLSGLEGALEPTRFLNGPTGNRTQASST